MSRYGSTAVVFACLVAASSFPNDAAAFTFSGSSPARCTTEMRSANNPDNDNDCSTSRRSAFARIAGASSIILGINEPAIAGAVDDDGTRGGVVLTPFNSLTFNYRGGGFTGLDASTLDEPSVSFQEFLDKLGSDQVEFVEFLAPDGDAAYVTFKANAEGEKQKPIRIGEGFPIEQHDGWSSPAFVVKAVKKRGVPYKFTVPGLEVYKNM